MGEKKLTGWIVLGLALVVLGFAMGGYFSWDAGSGTTSLGSFDADQVSSVRVEVSSLEVRVYDAFNDVLEVDAVPSAARRLELSLNNGELTLTERDRRSLSFLGKPGYVILWLPPDCAEKLSVTSSSGEITLNGVDNQALSVALNASSGEISAYDTVAADLTADASSGGVYLGDLTLSGSLECQTSSGHISVHGLRGGSAALTASSGGVSLSDARCRDAAVKTSSGYVSLDDVRADTVTAKSSSGSVSLRRLDAGEVVVETSSGSVTASLEGAPADYTAAASSASGRIQGLEEVGSGDRRLSLSTNSGHIQVEFEG